MADFDWKKVAGKIFDFAPILGTFLGGPLGAAGGGLLKVLANELGLKSDEATPDNFMRVLEADPNLVLKFKEFELAHKSELQKLVIEQERIELQRDEALLLDKQNARQRDMAIRQLGTTNTRANVMLLAAFVAVVAGWAVLYLGGQTIDSVLVGSITTIVGMFARNIGTAFDFEFGSSRGSMMKSQALEEVARNGK